MNKSFLVKALGFSAMLIHGDPTVIDRWRWVKHRLPKTHNGERLLDVGCGNGLFTIGTAIRGYRSLGLTWAETDQRLAKERALLCKAMSANFEVQDVRDLDAREDFIEKFDVILCLENIEHVLDDRKLMQSMAAALKPGGHLYVTTPSIYYKPYTERSKGPFSKVEDGGHVRRGYSSGMLEELCVATGLRCERISYCTGPLSLGLASVQIRMGKMLHSTVAWVLVLPFRIFPLVFDGALARLFSYEQLSICLDAYKPRFGATSRHGASARK